MRGAIAFAGLALAVVAFSAAAEDAGQIKTAQGSAQIERDGQRIAVAPGVHVRQSDSIITGDDGAVGVTLADNSLLSIGPNTVMSLDKYAFDTTTYDGQMDASIKKGTILVVSGKLVKHTPGAMRIHTPASIMGVRGTKFIVHVSEPQS
ncbi:MAG: FecR domain-containing protein [Burkholderiales bacterium]